MFVEQLDLDFLKIIYFIYFNKQILHKNKYYIIFIQYLYII